MIIAADIGGTNCRMALFDDADGSLAKLHEAWIATSRALLHAGDLLQAFETELAVSHHAVDMVVAAIAGPVANQEKGRLTNAPLEVDFAPLNRGGQRFYLINDFIAQAWAVLAPIKTRHITGPAAEIQGSRAVIGAGTGLGQAMLAADKGWHAIPSENGHAPFPFLDKDEYAFHDFMRKQRHIPWASSEHVLCGAGLASLHHFLTGNRLEPAEVGELALHEETETLAWYARFYARACRSWMLSTLCLGGLWIAGGIAARNPLCVTCGHFREELYNCPRWQDFLKGIPLYLMEDAASGLWGAAMFGLEQPGQYD